MIKEPNEKAALFLILTAILLVHIAVVLNDFHTDDFHVLGILNQGFDLETLRSMDDPTYFRPVSNILIFIRYVLFDEIPALWYILNLSLHLIVAGLLFSLVCKQGNKKAAIWACLFFGIYFQHFEAILWLYGIVRLLAAMFLLLALRSHLRVMETGRSNSNNNFRAADIFKSYIFFTLGLFCVEEFVVTALFFSGTAYFMGKHINRRFKIYAGGFVFLIVLFLAVRSLVLGAADFSTDYFFVGKHIVKNVYRYGGWMLFPQLDHPYFLPVISKYLPGSIPLIRIFNMLVFIAALGLTAFVVKKGNKIERVALFLTIVTLVPAFLLNFKVSTRHIYVPSIGFGIIAGSLIDRLTDRLKPKRRKPLIWLAVIYFLFHSLAINLTIGQYRHIQKTAENYLHQIDRLDIDWDRYDYILIDNLPGRVRLAPALKKRFAFSKIIYEVNDLPENRTDLEEEKMKLISGSKNFIMIDFSDGIARISAKYEF